MIINNLFDLQRWMNENGIMYFKADEFKCHHCGKVLIDTDLVDNLDLLRHLYGEPLVITSAYRCPEYNKQIGGVQNSAHTKGKAVDIKINTSRGRYNLIKTIFSNNIPFRRIGIDKKFIHLDIDNDKPQEVIWLY